MNELVEVNKREKFTALESVKFFNIGFWVIGFVFLNSVKLSIFNIMIMNSKTLEFLLYKLVYTLLINIVLYILFLKIKSRIPFLLLYAVQSVYIFANLSYFSYFHNYLHLFQAASLFTEGVGPVKHFTIPVNPGMSVILVDLPVFIGLMVHYSKMYQLYDGSKRIRRHLAAAALALLLIMEGYNLCTGSSIFQISDDFYTAEPLIIEKYGTVANSACDLILNYGGKNLINHFKYGKTVSAPSVKQNVPNVIAIQVESMDSNIIGKKHDGNYITPYLQELSQKSIYYPYALSYHKSGGTSDSEFSIINSIEALSNFPSIKIAKYDYPNSLIKRLNKGKYHTMVFHGNIGNYYNRDVAFPKMGFDEFYDIKRMGFEDAGWGAPDKKVFDYSLDKMKSQKGPFFSYIITMSSHTPFTSVDEYYVNNSYDNVEDDTVRNYFRSLSYVDNSIKDFVGQIKANFPNSYIFIWGDHTPDIVTDEYRNASYVSEDGYFEFVPVFIITPDEKAYRESSYAASFLDIAPTMLYASGIQYSIKSDGINLINPPSEKPLIPFKENYYSRDELYNQVIQTAN